MAIAAVWVQVPLRVLFNNFYSINQMARKRWTKEEDKVLITQVQKHCDNLSMAFRETSRILGDRSFLAIQYRWYAYLKNREENTVCFVLAGKNYSLKNSKKSSKNIKLKKHRVTIWTKIKKLLNL